jgi:hypothetical protein
MIRRSESYYDGIRMLENRQLAFFDLGSLVYPFVKLCPTLRALSTLFTRNQANQSAGILYSPKLITPIA